MIIRKFSKELIKSSGCLWDEAVNHKFFIEIKNGEIKDKVFENYLKIEYDFIDTAASSTGYAIAKAPNLKVKYQLANNIIDLATSQKNYFIEVANDLNLNLDEKIPRGILNDSKKLSEHFMNISSQYGFVEILTCMLGAELLYFTTCNKIISDNYINNDLIKEWIYMHTCGDFVENVKTMQEELERNLIGEGRGRIKQLENIFQQTLKAEISFHNAPYNLS